MNDLHTTPDLNPESTNPTDQTPKPTPPRGYTYHFCGCDTKKPNTKGPRDRYGKLK